MAATATTIIGGRIIAGTIQRRSASSHLPIGGIHVASTTVNAPPGGTAGPTTTRPTGGAAGRAARQAIGIIRGITATMEASTGSHAPATTRTASSINASIKSIPMAV